MARILARHRDHLIDHHPSPSYRIYRTTTTVINNRAACFIHIWVSRVEIILNIWQLVKVELNRQFKDFKWCHSRRMVSVRKWISWDSRINDRRKKFLTSIGRGLAKSIKPNRRLVNSKWCRKAKRTSACQLQQLRCKCPPSRKRVNQITS